MEPGKVLSGAPDVLDGHFDPCQATLPPLEKGGLRAKGICLHITYDSRPWILPITETQDPPGCQGTD